MVKHVVMWKFKEGHEEEVQRFLQGLRDLQGVIPQLKSSQVGENAAPGNYDAVLISEFESLEDLEAYKNDPRHVAVSQLCKAIRTDRVAVDFFF